MEELVKLVSQKTGLGEAQARVAVTTVLGFIKERLPAPLAGQVDALISGEGGGDDLAKTLGNLLNPK